MSSLWKTPKMSSLVTPTAPSLPAPIPPEKVVKEEEKKKIRRGARGQTILTGPRGVLTQGKIERRFLLGE